MSLNLTVNKTTKFFLRFLGLILVGYAFLGRGFAYLGYPPLFIGEVALAIGLFAFVFTFVFSSRTGRITKGIFRLPIVRLLFVFLAFGAVHILVGFFYYGMDALRDGVLFGYGIFAILVSSFLFYNKIDLSFIRKYKKLINAFLVWIPVAYVITINFDEYIPRHIYRDVPVIFVKPGDFAVHLAGIISFVLLGLHVYPNRGRASKFSSGELSFYALWILGFVIVASQNRGGFVAVMFAISFTLCFRLLSGLSKFVPIITLFILIMLAIDPKIDFGKQRKVSPRQLVANTISIFDGDNSEVYLSGSREWRLQWWEKIIDYTIFGDYFWTGKRMGINLANVDGFQVFEDESLRSPHNAHLVFLARTGVPGLTIWLILQIWFGLYMLNSHFRSVKNRNEILSKVSIWIIAYWLAFLANASFDVYLEGPPGGIWFWSLFGFGIFVGKLSKIESLKRRWDGAPV